MEYGVRAVQPAPLLLAEAPVVVAVAELDWPMYTFDKGRFERGEGGSVTRRHALCGR